MKKQTMIFGLETREYISPAMKTINVYTAEDTLLDYFTGGGGGMTIDEDPDNDDDGPRAPYFNSWDDMNLDEI